MSSAFKEYFLFFILIELGAFALCSWFWSRAFESVAVSLKFWDLPSGRKDHEKPTLIVGGFALLSAFLAASAFYIKYSGFHFPFLLIASGAIVAAGGGLFDDYLKSRGKSWRADQKLAAQILAALLPVLAGIELRLFVESHLNFAFSILWIVAVMNAWNFLDNMDGLLLGVATIVAFCFALVFAVLQQWALAGYCGALAGFSLGFLPHNFPKPKYFIGDGASALIGYFFAILAIAGSYVVPQGPGILAALVPVSLLAVPLFDMLQVVLVRLWKRQPVYVGDHNHLSHRLALRMQSRRKAVILIWGLTAMLGGIAVWIPRLPFQFALVLFGIQAAVFLFIFLWALKKNPT